MNSVNPKVAALFDAAVEFESPQQRANYLDRECPDPQLRQEVESMLAAHEQPDSVFAQKTMRVAAPNDEQVGTMIGRYKLLEKLGEGGFGAVWLAEQKEPVRRKVALKVIKLGMDTKNVVARFEAERQALALMDHPNIAKVLDAGTTEGGRPYFIMELVRGIPVTKFCDENKLATHERLDLFIKVCHAIQHAHQKGIIHRDLKPSNVLVTLHDGVPVPKVIDFGIAKATQQELTDKTIHTQFQQFIGTPAYVSPEQAEMSGLDIDTRSDIYSLGVLLYELLTGVTPFNAQALMQSGLDEMRRIIREDEPKRPSTRLSTLAMAEATALAKYRREKLPALVHLVRGDIDWIVMKCLEKDRSRRYETANGLAMDLQRHLSNEPVLARPPSAAYRFQKLVRRNKLATAAIAAVSLALMLGVVTTSWQASRARTAERTQADLAEQAWRAKEREVQQRSTSEQRLYDLLLSLATSKRQEGQVGYHDGVFKYLRQAAALEAPQKDPIALRTIAISCLGDVAGLTPTAITNFPANTEIRRFSMDPSGRTGAFTLSDGSIVLRKLPSGEEIQRLNLDGEQGAQLCEFSEDGQQLVSLHMQKSGGRPIIGSESTARVWVCGRDGHWGGPQRIPAPDADNAGFVNGHPYVCSYDDPAHLYKVMDLTSQKVVVQLEYVKRPRWIASASTPSGFFVMISRDDVGAYTIHVWDMKTDREPRTIRPTLEGSASFCHSWDGRYLACLGETSVEIYTIDNLERVAEQHWTLREPGRGRRRASFARSGTFLAIPNDPRRIRVWDWVGNREVAIVDGLDPEVGLYFLADDRYLLAVGNRQAELYPFTVQSERTVVSSRKPGITRVAFSPDSQRFGTVLGDGQLVVGDVWTGRSLWETNATQDGAGGRSEVNSVSISRDGLMATTFRLVMQGQPKSGLAFWQERRRLRWVNASTNEPPFIAFPEFTPDGRFLVALGGTNYAHNDARVHVWRVEQPSSDRADDGLELHPVMTVGDYGSIMALDNRRIAYASSLATNGAPEIHLVELEGPPTDRILGHGCPAIDGLQWIGFAANGRQLLVVNTNLEIVALDIVTGVEVTPPIRSRNGSKTKDRKTINFSLSPNGLKLAVFFIENAGAGVEIWDWKARRYLYSLPDSAGRVFCVRWSPDSQHLAVCNFSETSIWHLALVERVLADLGLGP